jgi:hypothetical protein
MAVTTKRCWWWSRTRSRTRTKGSGQANRISSASVVIIIIIIITIIDRNKHSSRDKERRSAVRAAAAAARQAVAAISANLSSIYGERARERASCACAPKSSSAKPRETIACIHETCAHDPGALMDVASQQTTPLYLYSSLLFASVSRKSICLYISFDFTLLLIPKRCQGVRALPRACD